MERDRMSLRKLNYEFIFNGDGLLDASSTDARFKEAAAICKTTIREKTDHFVCSLAISRFVDVALASLVAAAPNRTSSTSSGGEYGGYRQSLGFALADVAAEQLALQALLEEAWVEKSEEKSENFVAQASKCAEQLLEDLHKLLARFALAGTDTGFLNKSHQLPQFINSTFTTQLSFEATKSVASHAGIC